MTWSVTRLGSDSSEPYAVVVPYSTQIRPPVPGVDAEHVHGLGPANRADQDHRKGKADHAPFGAPHSKPFNRGLGTPRGKRSRARPRVRELTLRTQEQRKAKCRSRPRGGTSKHSWIKVRSVVFVLPAQQEHLPEGQHRQPPRAGVPACSAGSAADRREQGVGSKGMCRCDSLIAFWKWRPRCQHGETRRSALNPTANSGSNSMERRSPVMDDHYGTATKLLAAGFEPTDESTVLPTHCFTANAMRELHGLPHPLDTVVWSLRGSVTQEHSLDSITLFLEGLEPIDP